MLNFHLFTIDNLDGCIVYQWLHITGRVPASRIGI